MMIMVMAHHRDRDDGADDQHRDDGATTATGTVAVTGSDTLISGLNHGVTICPGHDSHDSVLTTAARCGGPFEVETFNASSSGSLLSARLASTASASCSSSSVTGLAGGFLSLRVTTNNLNSDSESRTEAGLHHRLGVRHLQDATDTVTGPGSTTGLSLCGLQGLLPLPVVGRQQPRRRPGSSRRSKSMASITMMAPQWDALSATGCLLELPTASSKIAGAGTTYNRDAFCGGCDNDGASETPHSAAAAAKAASPSATAPQESLTSSLSWTNLDQAGSPGPLSQIRPTGTQPQASPCSDSESFHHLWGSQSWSSLRKAASSKSGSLHANHLPMDFFDLTSPQAASDTTEGSRASDLSEWPISPLGYRRRQRSASSGRGADGSVAMTRVRRAARSARWEEARKSLKAREEEDSDSRSSCGASSTSPSPRASGALTCRNDRRRAKTTAHSPPAIRVEGMHLNTTGSRRPSVTKRCRSTRSGSNWVLPPQLTVSEGHHDSPDEQPETGGGQHHRGQCHSQQQQALQQQQQSEGQGHKVTTRPSLSFIERPSSPTYQQASRAGTDPSAYWPTGTRITTIVPATVVVASYSGTWPVAAPANSHMDSDAPALPGDHGSATPGGGTGGALAHEHGFEFATNPSVHTLSEYEAAPAARGATLRGGRCHGSLLSSSVDAHTEVKERAATDGPEGNCEEGTHAGAAGGASTEAMTAASGAVRSKAVALRLGAEGPSSHGDIVTGAPAWSRSNSQAQLMAMWHSLSLETCAETSEASSDRHASESGEQGWPPVVAAADGAAADAAAAEVAVYQHCSDPKVTSAHGHQCWKYPMTSEQEGNDKDEWGQSEGGGLGGTGSGFGRGGGCDAGKTAGKISNRRSSLSLSVGGSDSDTGNGNGNGSGTGSGSGSDIGSANGSDSQRVSIREGRTTLSRALTNTVSAGENESEDVTSEVDYADSGRGRPNERESERESEGRSEGGSQNECDDEDERKGEGRPEERGLDDGMREEASDDDLSHDSVILDILLDVRTAVKTSSSCAPVSSAVTGQCSKGGKQAESIAGRGQGAERRHHSFTFTSPEQLHDLALLSSPPSWLEQWRSSHSSGNREEASITLSPASGCGATGAATATSISGASGVSADSVPPPAPAAPAMAEPLALASDPPPACCLPASEPAAPAPPAASSGGSAAPLDAAAAVTPAELSRSSSQPLFLFSPAEPQPSPLYLPPYPATPPSPAVNEYSQPLLAVRTGRPRLLLTSRSGTLSPSNLRPSPRSYAASPMRPVQQYPPSAALPPAVGGRMALTQHQSPEAPSGSALSEEERAVTAPTRSRHARSKSFCVGLSMQAEDGAELAFRDGTGSASPGAGGRKDSLVDAQDSDFFANVRACTSSDDGSLPALLFVEEGGELPEETGLVVPDVITAPEDGRRSVSCFRMPSKAGWSPRQQVIVRWKNWVASVKVRKVEETD